MTKSLGDNTRSAEGCFTFRASMIMQFVVPREIRKTRVPQFWWNMVLHGVLNTVFVFSFDNVTSSQYR